MSPKYFLKNKGYCYCCDREVKFVAEKEWLRDFYVCSNCLSIPRERALMYVIESYYPNWKDLSIHESSPIHRGASLKLKANCKNYIPSQYFAEGQLGEIINGIRNENLEKQTFDSAAFDLVISQDVFEHLFNPGKAFKEITRTLKVGGSHIFTVPLVNKENRTEKWAEIGENGEVHFLKEPEYHDNPVDPKGSPVAFHWGYDISDFILESSGLYTTIVYIDNIDLGIRAELIEVLISKKLK